MKSLSQVQSRVADIPKDIVEEMLRDTYKKSLYATAHSLLGMKDVSKVSHKEILDVLESDSKRRIICTPRGSLKSSIAVVSYSIWRIINNPNIRILIDSAIYTNSKNFIREIRSHLESDKLTRLFGVFKSDLNWAEGNITVRQRTHPYKEATLTSGGVGTSKVSQHFDEIIIDDLSAEKNSATSELREKVYQHYQMNVALLEPEGIMTIIGTRYAADDLFGKIFEKEIQIQDPGTI